MISKARTQESGLALVFALLGVIVAAALSGSLVMITMIETRAATAATERAMAFYLAESGLQAARWEIGENDDPAADGEGTLSGNGAVGRYAVAATNLGGGYFRLDSNAESGGAAVTLEEVVLYASTSRFPGGALSIVGDLTTTEMLLGPNTDLLIDGANSPGIVLSNPDTYNQWGTYFAQGVSAGFIAESDVTGVTTNTFDPGDAVLSIAQVPEADVAVSITADMYTDLRNEIDTVWLPSAAARTIPASGSATWGTAASPVRYKFPVDQKIKSGQTISGHGTLLFPKNLVIEAGGRLDWNGNVIVYGQDGAGNDSVFEVDGTVNVNGNILVMGGLGRNVTFLEKALGSITVNGAVTVLTDFANPATQIQFLIENNFTVEGLVTLVAPKQQNEFKPGSDVYIKGSLQVGRIADVVQPTEIKFKFEEEAEFYKDDSAIMAGATALVALGSGFGNDVLESVLTTGEIEICSWREIPSQ